MDTQMMALIDHFATYLPPAVWGLLIPVGVHLRLHSLTSLEDHLAHLDLLATEDAAAAVDKRRNLSSFQRQVNLLEHSNVPSAPRHSRLSTTGRDTKNPYTCLWNGGSVARMDRANIAQIMVTTDVYSVRSQIHPKATRKFTTTRVAQSGHSRRELFIGKITSDNI